jgi:hypothetical protein
MRLIAQRPEARVDARPRGRCKPDVEDRASLPVELAATTIDLRRGGEAALPHALAAVYLGVSVAWGRRMVGWADARFAHRFAGGPAPARPPRTGRDHAAHQRREWLRHLAAWAVGSALLGLGVLLVGDPGRTWALLNVAMLWTLVLAIDFVISFSYALWPRET